MTQPGYYELMARYNRWANREIYNACAAIPDDVRRHDQGIYFRSIHGTLNHLLHADHIWMDRFCGRPLTHTAFGVDLFDDFDSLSTAQSEMNDTICAWARSLDPAWLAAKFTFTTASVNRTFSQPAWMLVTNLFNHQTYHRGQLTVLIQQGGFNAPAIDLLLLPDNEIERS